MAGRVESARFALEAAMSVFGAAAAFVGLGQAAVYHGHELCWSEIDYYLQVRQVHIETLHNLREEIRDMHEIDSRKVDSGMVVATLMLAIGFGFVVEGTFPARAPASGSPLRAAYAAQAGLRLAYAVVAALSLVFPLWSVLCLMECRRRLCFFMECFNQKFQNLMEVRLEKFSQETGSVEHLHTSHLVRYTRGLPRSKLPSCPRRNRPPAVEEREDRTPGDRMPGDRDRAPDNYAPGDFGMVLSLRNDYARWWQHWCERPYSLATSFHMLGIIFNVLCCIGLLGFNFAWKYPETPWMWRTYVFVLSSGLGVALVLSGLSACRGPTVDPYGDLRRPLMEPQEPQDVQEPQDA